MSDLNSSLQITIDVVDSNGSVTRINATTSSIQQLGAAGKKASEDLGAIGSGPAASALSGLASDASQASRAIADAGAAGETMGTQVAAGMQQVSGHTLTALDNVRLLRDDLGIHIPRGMESAIARSATLSSAIAGFGGLLVGLGAAEIFFQLGTAIYDAYEKYISLNAAAEAYAETVQKNKDADFTNTHSIEETTARINEATAAAANFKTQADAIHNQALFELNPVKGVGDLILAHDLASDSVQKQAQVAALKAKSAEYDNTTALAQINLNHAMDSTLQGQQKINAEKQKAHELDAQRASYARTQDSALQGGGLSHAGEQEQRQADAQADATAAAQTIELGRQTAAKANGIRNQTTQLESEARNAGLQGIALYRAQEEEALDAIGEKVREKALTQQQADAQTNAISLKFHNEEMQRLQAETDEVNKRARAEQEASLTGLQKIEAQGKDRDDDINQKQARGLYADQTGAGSSSANADKDRATSHEQMIREIKQSEVEFNQQVTALSNQATDRQLTGYAKIDAAEQERYGKLNDYVAAEYGNLSEQDARYNERAQASDAGTTAIREAAERQRVDLHSKTMSEISEIEVQAGKVNQTEDRAATGAIVDEYNKRVAAARAMYEEQLALAKGNVDTVALLNQELYARIKADADLAGAQMEKQAQETRDKLADSLGSLFDDPAGFLEKRAKDLMYKVLANGIESATNNLQSSFGQGIAQILGIGPDLKAPVGKLPGTAGAGSPLTAAGSTLTQAGTTLQTSGTNLGTAGTHLDNSGTALNTAGTQLTDAASALQGAATALSSAQGGGGFAGVGGGSAGGYSSSNDGSDGIGDSSGDDSGGSGLANASGLSGATVASTGASLSSAAAGFAGGGVTGLAAGSEGAASALSKASGTTSSLGKYAGAAGAAVAGGVGIYSAFENSNPLGGALAGGEAGAQIGGLFGPEGALIGAGIGAVVGLVAGLFGDNGKAKAKAYDTGTVAPALATELANFNSGQTGYTQASRDLTNILNQAQQATQAMGSGARHYFTDSITPEIAAVQTKLDAEEKAGRSRITMSAAQFHSGGLITGFGDFGTGGTEGFIHAMMGERVMNAQASASHGPMLDALNAGYSPAPLLSSQMRSAATSIAGGSTTRLGAGGGGEGVTLSLSALDGPSTARWLRMGGGKLIQQHLNAANGQYGGKADG